MKIIPNLVQGSAPWHEHRRLKWNASESPAMLDESPHMSRAEFLRRRATGIEPEVDGMTQKRFDRGYTVEPLLIKLAAEHLGEPLHPFVAVADFDERYSASFDGCTFVGDITTECKLLNARLRAAFADMETIAPEHRESSAGKCLPIDYRIQLEQQLRVAEADRALFITGELRDDETLGDVFSCWYYPDDALWARIQAGWPQFEEDCAAYVPTEAAPLVVAAPVEALPSVFVQVTGSITITDNFKAFENALTDFLEHRLIREPKTDQDFADLDKQIKAMKGAEAALDTAEAGWIAQIEAVSTAKGRKDMLAKLVRDNRLMAEKLLASEKERRKGEIVRAGINALNTHFAELNERIGKPYMPASAGHADFAGAIKGLRSMDAMENAVSVLLATAKIEANRIEAGISKNLGWLRENAKDFTALFPDTGAIVLKAHDDLVALAQNRIQAHKDAEQKRLDAERETIRAEEQAKAEKAAREAQEAEDALVTSIWGNARRIEGDSSEYVRKAIGMFESGAKDWANDPRPRVAGAVAAAREEMKGKLDAALAREAAAPAPTPEPAVIASPTVVSGPAPGVLGGPIGTPVAANVVPMGTRPPAAPSALPPLKLGDINARLQHISVNEAGLAALGFTATKVKGACMYAEADWGRMCDSIVAQVRAAQHQQLQAA